MTRRATIPIPIYEVTLYLSLSETRDDMVDARNRMNGTFGKPPSPPYEAMACWNSQGEFGIFMYEDSADHNTVAHEIFHVAHRIDDQIGGHFDSDHHEHVAYLVGYITEQVWKRLERWQKSKKRKAA